ncbi:MAG: methionine--tRNA ligase [bacterium]|nr:methionine--tRNA ligase [bacterium]
MNKKYFVSTPIYYANGLPHVGHFLTTTAADVIARYYRQVLGKENVFFTTGLDEHGTTVEQAAEKEGFNINTFQEYVDKRAKQWKESFDKTNISYDYFVRTTNPRHERFAQDFIRKMIKNGDVYKGKYQGKYCNGCEKFLTFRDLNEEGHCPLHRPDQTVVVEEENYFFKLSKYAPKVKALIEKGEIKIIPGNKRSEILSRLKDKIEDVSISRPKEKVAWGVKFPDDPKHTIYIWVEALLNYTSSLEINNKHAFWENSYHFLGKDISWFHNVIWPAMLLSVKHPVFKGTFVHGFFLANGAKISKSLGNIITPRDLVDKFGIDGARYLILSNFPFDNDTDITLENLAIKYNADLANGLGNLVSRVAKLCESSNKKFEVSKPPLYKKVGSLINDYRFDLALSFIWEKISELDREINLKKPWGKQNDELYRILKPIVSEIRKIAFNLKPFLPGTAEKIEKQYTKARIKSGEPLFPRLK